MILTDVQVEGFRRFAAPVRLDGLGPGLNVLAAPNEAGKSTLLLALRAALTLRHSSKSSVIKGFAPYGGGAPHVALSFTWKGMACTLEKRFLTKTCARLRLGPEQFEGDQAEEKLRDLLGLADAGKGEAAGLWNALLVGQGESFTQPNLNEAGHASLRDCLEQGVEKAVGGAAASAVLAKVRDRLLLLQTASTGKPTGRYKQALEQEQAAQDRLQTLEARKAALEEDLVALEQARRILREQEDPERRAHEEAALKELRLVRDKVLRLDAEELAARAALTAAITACSSARQEQERRQENKVRQLHLERACAESQQTLDGLAQKVRQARRCLDLCRQKREQAEQHHQHRRQQRMVAARRATLQQMQDTLAQERALLHRAEAAFARLEQEQAILAALRVDEASIQRMRKAARQHEQAVALLEANAPVLSMALLPEAAQRVTLNGAPCREGEIRLTATTTVQIEGVGQFQITPARQEQDDVQGKVQAALTQLETLLQQAGCQNVAEAEHRFEEHRQAQVRLVEARAAYRATLPDGTDLARDNGGQALAALRKTIMQKDADLALARKESIAEGEGATADADGAPPCGADTLLTPDQAAEAEDHAAREAENARHAERDEQAACAVLQTEQDKADAALRALTQALEHLQREQAVSVAREADEALAQRAEEAQRAQATAQARVEQLAQARQEEQPLSVVESGIRRREQALDTARTAITRLREDIRGRETRVRLAEGEGVDEQIAEACRAVERLRLEREGCERERAALVLLQNTLGQAERTQTERYLAPLRRTIQPAFSAVFPGASVAFDTSFGVEALTRRQAEEFNKLSDGTQEQISVLVRLGFAELLHARQGSSILVLDDALSFSDSLRLERVFDVLADAATRFQILVLTCRAETFATLGGRALTLQPVAEFTEPR